MGVLSLGYDMLPFFGPAVILVLLRRRLFLYLAITAVLLVLPEHRRRAHPGSGRRRLSADE